MVTGSSDGTAVAWSVGGSHNVRDEMLELFGGPQAGGPGGSSGGGKQQLLSVLHYLAGHRGPVLCVAVSSAVGLVASGGEDGRTLLHSLQTGAGLRSFVGLLGGPVDVVALAPGAGAVVAHSRRARLTSSHSVNGRALATSADQPPEQLLFCVVAASVSQELLVCGHAEGDVTLRRVHDLVVTRRIGFTKRFRGVRCAACASNGRVLYLGCQDGSLVVCSDEESGETGGDGRGVVLD